MSNSRAARTIVAALSLLLVGAALLWVLSQSNVDQLGPSCAASFSC